MTVGRWLPRSLFGRLLAIAALTSVAALAFAGFTIGHVLERFVIHGLDQQLDAQIGSLARAVRPDGTFDAGRAVLLPAFETPGSGWSWQVDGSAGQRWSGGGAMDVADLRGPPPWPHGRERWPDPTEPRPGDGRLRSGLPVHFRRIVVQTPAGPVTVTASGPRHVALAPLREALVPLLGSLALLGAGLGLATALQLRFGLRPLRDLQASVAEVRAGRVRRVPPDQPNELGPLAAELNALIDQNAAGLEHARRHVANLAHGLKTPLAALSLKLGEPGRDPDGSLGEAVARIDRHVRHHLGRARAAAPGSTRMRTPLAPALADLVSVLRRIHADRAVTAALEVADGLAVAIDPQDLAEMVGNLLDNGWRHARTAISIAAARAGPMVVLVIDDDGPGLGAAAIGEALLPGRRLDERGDGHGFGLPISRELAELNGGDLSLSASPTLGGLRVRLSLPGDG